MADIVVGHATITVGADASQFDKDLAKHTTQAAEEHGSRFSDALGTSLKRGAQVVGAGVGLTLGIGLNTAMESEVAQMKFTQLFKGQTDKAAGFITELKDFAARTPFDFPGLSNAATKLLTVGVEAKNVIPLLTNIGDITGIKGTGAQGIERATYALQQMGTKGRVTGEELMQLTEAGIPGLQLLAETMGLSTQEVQKLVEKGLVPADKMFEALGNNSSATMQTFAGGMEKLSQTTQGKLSTLKDNFSQFAGGLVEGALPAINGFVSVLSDNVIPAIKDFAGRVGEWIKGINFQPLLNAVKLVWDYVVGFITDATVREWADRAIAGVQALAGWVKDTLIPALVDMGGKVRDVVNFFREHEGAAKALGVTIGIVSALIISAWVAQGVVAVVESVKQVIAWIVTATASTTSSTIQSKSTAQIVFGWAAAGAAAVLHGAVIVAQWAWMGVQALLHAAKVAAAWLIALGPIGLIIAAVVALVAVVIYNLDTIKAFISGAWDWITEITYNTWQNIYSWLEGAWNSITDNVSSWLNNVMGWINTAWEWIKSATEAAWNVIKWFIFGPIGAIVLFVMNNLDTIKGIISGAWEWIKSTTSNAWNAVTSFISTAWDNIKRAVSERIDAVVGFARELPGKIVGAVGDLARLLWEKGTAAIQGLLDGAMEKIRGIGSWASDIKDKIIDAIKSVFGIHSPSTVMAGLGVNMMQGLLNGLLQSPQALMAAVKSIGGNLTDWLGGVGSRIGEFFSNLFGGASGTLQAGKISVSGKLLDTDTYARIVAALGGGWRLNQGSWSNSVAASMGTHSGSGVADITPAGGWAQAVAALNAAGLRAIFRNWPGNQHIHLINPNVSGQSPQALSQLLGEFSLQRMFGAGYAGGTGSAMPGWALVGEHGPEWMRFRGGEQVLPNGQTPGIAVTMNVSVDDLDKMTKIGDFLDMLERSRLDSRRTARSGMVSA